MDEFILNNAAARYGAHSSSFQLLGGFANNVYECASNEQRFVLKFLSSSNHTPSAIKGELEWMEHLSTNGLHVTQPIRSRSDHFIETIQVDQERYFVVAFEKAQGRFADETEPQEWNSRLFELWGRAMGRMHALAKMYEPSNESVKRSEWYEESVFTDFPACVGQQVIEKWRLYKDKLRQLPTDRAAYGLIHHDLHQKNFYVHNGDIVLFDFGDCTYHWFAYDIAISLYHALQSIPAADTRGREQFAPTFLASFLQGYACENDLARDWLLRIPSFLNYRQLYSYVYLSKFLASEQHDDNVKKILDKMRHNIENDIPYVDLHMDELLPTQ